jgi:hypothetical protein
MARGTVKRAGDITGRETQRLQAEHIVELQARADEISLINAAALEVDETPVVLIPVDPNAEPVPPVHNYFDGPDNMTDDELQQVNVEVEQPMVKFRVNEDLEKVTIGQGNIWDFTEGRTYIAPRHVYDHLEEKGYIWH